MPSFWPVVNKVIEDADILLLLLDARLVEETRNKEIEDKVRKSGKTLIYVVTKCDLVDKRVAERYKQRLKPCVFISAKEFHGTKLLRERILIETKKLGWDRIRVGVLGYPNVGKSSLINAMKGKKSASTSSMSGHTHGVQKIKGDNKLIFLDTPGVIPYKEEDKFKHSLIGSIDFTKSKNPDLIVLEMLEKYPGKLEKFYGVSENEDKEKVLEEIGRKRNILKKGNEVDMDRLAREILKDWQTGKIK